MQLETHHIVHLAVRFASSLFSMQACDCVSHLWIIAVALLYCAVLCCVVLITVVLCWAGGSHRVARWHAARELAALCGVLTIDACAKVWLAVAV